MKILTLALTLAALTPIATFAVDAPIKIGVLSTFSGPNSLLGQDTLDGFNLGLKAVGGTLGGRPVQIIQTDDQAKPEAARQAADKMVESDRIQILTGIIFSNVMLAVAKPALDAGVFVISSNAGPSQYAGKQCHPHFFGVAFQNDVSAEAMGTALNSKGLKRIYLMGANYPAGRDFLAGFKHTFKGEIVAEVYTTFGQLDYAAEIAQLRSKKPEGVFFFYPGGMGVNFVKQYSQAGLTKEIPLFAPSYSLDQTVLPAVGEAGIGAFASSSWSETWGNPQTEKFVADFEATTGRLPSSYAADAYDTAVLIDAALKSIGGKIEDKAAFQKALETVKFETLRGKFRFNVNHFPIQDYFLTEAVMDAKSRPVMAKRELIAADVADSFVGDCKMSSGSN